METITFDQDIPVYCIPASSFPEGVRQAHQKLHSLVPLLHNRKYFGLSWPGRNGKLEYKAAATELAAGELSKHNLEPYTIPAGNYLCVEVQQFMQNIQAIGAAFGQLQAQPNLHPEAMGIEWYYAVNACHCLMRLK